MKKFLIAIAMICLSSCSNQRESIKTLDEVQTFYLEFPEKGLVVHVDKNCAKSSCVYLDKKDIKRNDEYLCSKCISIELYNEIKNLPYK